MKNYALLTFVSLLLATPSLFGQTNAPAAGPRDQLQQLTEQLQKTPDDEALREKIINLARTLAPPPELPEETTRRMARGVAAFKDAKSVSDYKDAVAEFEKATLAAPWYADAYYNLGKARAKAEDYAGASVSLKLYLLAAPGAKDAAEAKTLMYEMEYKGDKAEKERSAAQAKEQQLAQAKQLAEHFRGNWEFRYCMVGKTSTASVNRGCDTDERLDVRNWFKVSFVPLQFEIENDGTIKMPAMAQWGGCTGDVFGIPQGASFGDIRWEVRPTDGSPRQIWVEGDHTCTYVVFTCTRPPDGGDRDAPYRYGMFLKTP
jgi:tetratricopeptide (TPR) repeat protein